ncbi:hypothetical protein [Pseudomonas donghuensis]|uniref:hypothetical protein n=1 Tax=Pseudomonas donghuensis TaxID=1163398 RepID=UPI000299F1E5|nr:hypothetical protein [Pseudomonas donghuensis]
MTSNSALKLELGAAVAFTVGIAFKSIEDRIKENTNVLESIYAEVFSLRNGATPAPQGRLDWLGELRPYLQATLNLLERQVVALGRFRQQQIVVAVGKAGPPATDTAPKRDNLKVIEDIPLVGEVLKRSRVLLLPTQISAEYQKITRDLAISAGVADGAEPSAQEQAIIAKVTTITDATGMERNQAAELIKQLFDTGMGLNKALAYAPVAARFAVGQDVSAKEAARLVGEVQKKPQVSGPDELEKALEHIVFQRKGTGEGAADSLSAAQNQTLDKALGSTEASGAKGVLDRDLLARRGTSDQRLSEASNAVDEALRSLGDSLRPLADGLALGVAAKAKEFTAAPDALKWLVVGVTVLGTTLLALKGGEAAKGLLNRLKRKPTPEGAAGGPGQGTDLSNVNVLNNPLNVFVVNASDIGCCVRKPGQRRKPTRNGRKAPQGRTSQRRAPQRQPRASTRRAPTRPAPAPRPSTPPPAPPASPVGAAGKIGAAIKGVRGPALLTAGINTVATFMTADTPEEKAEGYGAAAGGLVGSVIGGVVGSFVPVIGTSIGAMLGGMAGDAIGGWLGKRMVSCAEGEKPADTQAQPTRPVAAQPGEVARSLVSATPANDTLPAPIKPVGEGLGQPQSVTQQFTFTPSMPITVQGSVTDPMLLAQNLQAMVRREFEELMRMANSRQLSDVPHVYV